MRCVGNLTDILLEQDRFYAYAACLFSLPNQLNAPPPRAAAAFKLRSPRREGEVTESRLGVNGVYIVWGLP